MKKASKYWRKSDKFLVWVSFMTKWQGIVKEGWLEIKGF